MKSNYILNKSSFLILLFSAIGLWISAQNINLEKEIETNRKGVINIKAKT